MRQVKMTGAVTPKYGEDERYPGKLMVAMDDGRVMKYRIEIDQPHPSFLKAMGNLERMVIGYRPKHAKK